MNICKQSLPLVLVGIICIPNASAETYKCKDSDNKFIYSNVACPVGTNTEKALDHKQGISVVGSQVQSGVASSQSNITQSDLRYLDEKVDEAIKYDLRVAKQLALTPEHWKKIKAAEENLNKPVSKSNVVLESSVQQPQSQTQQIQPQVLMQQTQPQIQTGTLQTQQMQQLQEQQRQQQLQLQQAQQQQQQQQLQQLQQLQQQQLQQAQQQLQAQQLQQQKQQQRQSCLAQIQNQSAASRRAIEGAGVSASSMQALLVQRATVEAARCNSIQ